MVDQRTGIELYRNEETNNQVNGKSGVFAAFFGKVVANLKLAVPAALVALALMSPQAFAGQTRALKIYHIHSHEKATIVFKRNGRYDTAGLKKLNMILRDWRRNESTRMDPRLFDLIWEVYQKSGSNDYIHVIGGYRAPETNAMLRSRSKGVAEKSQHILGKAMDFYIPDVPLRRLREIGIKFQVGGVGFYPTSGSPFVHMDVGGVRAWPRMPRRELARLFPDGRTLHKPAEGGTMPGYAAALADYRRRVGADAIVVAGGGSLKSDTDRRHSKSLLAALFSGGNDAEEDVADAAASPAEEDPVPVAKRNKVEEQPVLTAAVEPDDGINAPVPGVRPTYIENQPALETALLSQNKNPAEEAMQAALAPQPVEAEDGRQQEFANLALVHVPVPQLLGNRRRPGDSEVPVLTASAEPLQTNVAEDPTIVPLPVFRPGEEVATRDVAVPPADVKPEEIAALAAETGDSGVADNSTDEDEDSAITDSLDAADAADAKDNLAEMAALDVDKPATVTRSFVLPANLDAAALAPVPEAKVRKGGRAKIQADSQRLTKNLIAKWAIENGRVALLSKPIKAPRFVSQALVEQPTEVYAAGFAQNAVNIDPGRFSGEATFKVEPPLQTN